MELVYSLAGLGVGLIVGLTGVGGGALMTPVLLFVFGFAPYTAVGTDLVFAAITKCVGVWVHGKRGSVDWGVVKLLSLGSLPAAGATLLVMHTLHTREMALAGTIVAVLGCALILTGLGMVFKNRLHSLGRKKRTETPHQFKRWQPHFTVAAGAVLGVLVTLTSIGAGALGAVMLVYLYPFRLTTAKLVGTDLAHAIPLTLLAGSGHLYMGNVDFSLLGYLLLGSIPGIYLGSRFTALVPERVLRVGLASMLVMIGARMLW